MFKTVFFVTPKTLGRVFCYVLHLSMTKSVNFKNISLEQIKNKRKKSGLHFETITKIRFLTFNYKIG
jgi:hypothetical protein